MKAKIFNFGEETHSNTDVISLPSLCGRDSLRHRLQLLYQPVRSAVDIDSRTFHQLPATLCCPSMTKEDGT